MHFSFFHRLKRSPFKFIFCLSVLLCNLHGQEVNEPKFVSLGCTSQLLTHFRNANIKSVSPFNLLLTADYEGFINVLKSNFSSLLTKECLTQDLNFCGISYRVFNNCYGIDFRHDWHDIDTDFDEYLPNIKVKYERLIRAFNELSKSSEKVYFVRAAFPAGWINNNYYSPASTASNYINYQQAETLVNILTEKFPELDFTLIIVNYSHYESEQIIDLKKVIEYKIDVSKEEEEYFQILTQLKRQG